MLTNLSWTRFAAAAVVFLCGYAVSVLVGQPLSGIAAFLGGAGAAMVLVPDSMLRLRALFYRRPS